MKSVELYSSKQRWKIILSIVALVIIALTLWYANYITNKIQKDERLRVKLWSETVKKQAQLVNLTNQTFEQLKVEERENVALWVKALKEFAKERDDYTFVTEIVAQNNSIPTIVETIDRNGKFSVDYSARNVARSKSDFDDEKAYQTYLKELINEWEKTNKSFTANSLYNQTQIVHYGNSKLFRELKSKSDSLIKGFNSELIKNNALLPILFINSKTREVIASNLPPELIIDSIAVEKMVIEMKADNKPITVSLSEEVDGEIYYFESATLKQVRYYPWIQLGIIALFLLVAYVLFSTFRKAEQNQVWAGMAKETAHQLGTPLSSLMAWIELLRAQGVDPSSLDEMDKDIIRLNTITDRFSKIGSEVKLEEKNVSEVIQNSIEYLEKRVSKKVQLIQNGEEVAVSLINVSLFEWVIENLTKNAIDAITGEGKIIYSVSIIDKQIIIDITDTGKGIPANKYKSVFQPGYTTKKRGWGLGLSLVKRIVEEQLKGRIFVKSSEIGVGTTFRIVLKTQNQ